MDFAKLHTYITKQMPFYQSTQSTFVQLGSSHGLGFSYYSFYVNTSRAIFLICQRLFFPFIDEGNTVQFPLKFEMKN